MGASLISFQIVENVWRRVDSVDGYATAELKRVVREQFERVRRLERADLGRISGDVGEFTAGAADAASDLPKFCAILDFISSVIRFYAAVRESRPLTQSEKDIGAMLNLTLEELRSFVRTYARTKRPGR